MGRRYRRLFRSGRAFGRRKLAPTISPGKTWEGVAGAVVGVFIYAGVVLFVFSPLAALLTSRRWPCP
jgi:CDP-diglyceride synthetase